MKNVDNLKYHYQKLFFENLPDSIKTKVYIAGGALRDYLNDDEIKDIDLFTDSKETEDALINFFKANAKLINENSLLANYTYKDKWFQIIRGKYYKDADELIQTFDFTICQSALYYEAIKIEKDNGEVETKYTVQFTSSESFFQDTLAKHLRINYISFPLSTLERMQKYIQKGYTACNGTLLEVAKSMKDVDFDNPNQNTIFFYPNGTARFVGVD